MSHNTAVTLLFEHLPSQENEIQYFEIFSHLWENQLAQLFFAKISLQKQIFIKLQNDCDPYIEICLLSNEFFSDNFINHFQKIHESVLHKIKTDLLYFWAIYDINLWENIFAEVQLIHAEQMSLYNFIILKKKRLQYSCFPVEFVKLSRTAVAASENT